MENNSVKKLIYVWTILFIITMILVFFSDFVYKIWVGPNIKVPLTQSVATGVFVIIANWNNIFGAFINGVGKVRIQLYYSIFAAVLNILLSVFLARFVWLGVNYVGNKYLFDNCIVFISNTRPQVSW